MKMAVSRKQQFNISKELNEPMITSRFRVSYNHILEPWTNDEDKPAKYSLQMIFDKDDKWLREAKERVKAIAVEAFGPNAVKLMRSGKLKNPFRDGDDEFPDNEDYAGKTFFNANGSTAGKRPPGLINQRKRNIRDMDNAEEVFYSGCYARAEIKFYPFDQQGGKGVACFVFNVQKMAEGESMAGSGRKAEDVFDAVEEDDDDVLGIDDDDLDDLL
jgi:hypothetical protein